MAQEFGPMMSASSVDQSRGSLPSEGMFQEILLARISIEETEDRGES